MRVRGPACSMSQRVREGIGAARHRRRVKRGDNGKRCTGKQAGAKAAGLCRGALKRWSAEALVQVEVPLSAPGVQELALVRLVQVQRLKRPCVGALDLVVPKARDERRHPSWRLSTK